MTESFLHYIWQFQYFNKKELKTSDGEELQVFNPGTRNPNAGPDFSEAKLKIGDLEWRGSVELHIKASGWADHRHGDDAAYENVVLHVVWENDKPMLRSDGSPMPTLELKGRVDPGLWDSYKRLFTSPESIPCTPLWPTVNELIKLSMLDKVLVQRLEVKAGTVLTMLHHNQGDWEETSYQLLLRNFGFKVNAEPFLQLAKSLPYKLLHKHADQPLQVEALLFGQAGFLEKQKEDEYTNVLVREYIFLSKKYKLEARQMHKSQWRFMRLRPANFPTVRIAQLAALITTKRGLVSTILADLPYNELSQWLDVRQSTYWQRHYQFGKEVQRVPALGKTSVQNIIVNTVVPLLAAYSVAHDDQRYMDRAVDLLHHIPAEINKIIRQWKTLGYSVKTSFDSQALIELYNSYCLKRRCLECAVGASIIKPG